MVRVSCICIYAEHVQIVLQVRLQCHIRCHLLLLSRQTPTHPSFWLSTATLNFWGKEGNLI